MMYDNLTNEELLNEVYLTQHKDRLLTLVCERLEMVMREANETAAEEFEDEIDNLRDEVGRLEGELAEAPMPDEFEDEIDNLRSEIDRLNDNLAAQDEEIFTLNKKIDDLESQVASLTDDEEF